MIWWAICVALNFYGMYALLSQAMPRWQAAAATATSAVLIAAFGVWLWRDVRKTLDDMQPEEPRDDE